MARVHRGAHAQHHNAARSGRVYQGGYAPAKRTDGPRPAVRAIACPDCPAGIGEPCISAATGLPKTTVHVARHRLAIRQQNADREAAAAAPAPAPAVEEELVFGQGNGPVARCSSCSCLFHAVKGEPFGLARQLAIPAHQPGGGRYSSRRGDPLCAGAFLAVEETSS